MAFVTVFNRVSSGVVFGKCFGRWQAESGFKCLAEVLNPMCCDVPSSQNVVELVVPPELCFSTKTGIEALLQLALITSLGSNSNPICEVVYIPVVVLSIPINDIRISPFVWHVWVEEADV